VRGPQEHRLQGFGGGAIRREAPTPGGQPGILKPPQRLAEAGEHVECHAS
jgi:hypothetical protein